jgi:hypothetical protein
MSPLKAVQVQGMTDAVGEFREDDGPGLWRDQE